PPLNAPPTSAPGAMPLVPLGQTGTASLPGRADSVSLTQQKSAQTWAPTTAAAASITKSTPLPAPSPRPTMMEKFQNWLHPKRETTVVQSAETRSEKSTDMVGAVTPLKGANDVVPFSTAADSGTKIKKLSRSEAQSVANANPAA